MAAPVYKFDSQLAFDNAVLERAARQTDQPIPESAVYWDKFQSSKVDENYKMTLMYQGIQEANPVQGYFISAMLALLKEEFNLKHDIRWIGVMITFQTPGEPGTGGREDAAFMVHEEDIVKIGVKHRLLLNVRWWFDVVGGGELRLFPFAFRRNYKN